jgi:hypothetical protein
MDLPDVGRLVELDERPCAVRAWRQEKQDGKGKQPADHLPSLTRRMAKPATRAIRSFIRSAA